MFLFEMAQGLFTGCPFQDFLAVKKLSHQRLVSQEMSLRFCIGTLHYFNLAFPDTVHNFCQQFRIGTWYSNSQIGGWRYHFLPQRPITVTHADSYSLPMARMLIVFKTGVSPAGIS